MVLDKDKTFLYIRYTIYEWTCIFISYVSFILIFSLDPPL